MERLQDGRESVAVSHFGRVVGVFVPVEEYDRLVAESPMPPPAELTKRFDSLVESMEKINRVQKRVACDDHDIPEEKMRSRYTSSFRNLASLLPKAARLELYDNSAEGSHTALQLV
jgi:hypothetical protein